MTELERYRAKKDTFFKANAHSPLTPEQQTVFAGLRYFPENPELRLVLPIEQPDDRDGVVMQTSSGDERAYARYGRLRFSAAGQEVALTVYVDHDSGELFLPFADALRGRETYGVGRYLEPQLLADGQLLVDFNLAYNPYCAYNDGWSCPLTPAENWIQVPIRAGERIYHTAE